MNCQVSEIQTFDCLTSLQLWSCLCLSLITQRNGSKLCVVNRNLFDDWLINVQQCQISWANPSELWTGCSCSLVFLLCESQTDQLFFLFVFFCAKERKLSLGRKMIFLYFSAEESAPRLRQWCSEVSATSHSSEENKSYRCGKFVSDVLVDSPNESTRSHTSLKPGFLLVISSF